MIDQLSVRELQRESARALAAWRLGNNELSYFTKQAHHDSHQFYKAVLTKYIEEYGGLPSLVGPGAEIRLVSDV